MTTTYEPVYITRDDFADIRDKLGNATEDLISDDVIVRLSYLQLAEADITEKIKDLEITEVQQLYIKVAVIYYTAWLLVPKIQTLLKSENIQDYSYVGYTPDEWTKLKDSLYERYQYNIGLVLTNYYTPSIISIGNPDNYVE